MTTSQLIQVSLIFVTVAGLIIYSYSKLSKNTTQITESASEMPPDFYRINGGNQSELIFAPAYNKQWFDELDKKYSWDNFVSYDNRFWEYAKNLLDTVHALAKGNTKSDRDFFNKLTRGQKVFYSVMSFGNDTNNGGVYQFFFNKPEFSFAVLESFKELKLDSLSLDYEKCLDEFIGSVDSYGKRKEIFNDPKKSWEKRYKSFQEGYLDIKSAKKIEEYFYNFIHKYKFDSDYFTIVTMPLKISKS